MLMKMVLQFLKEILVTEDIPSHAIVIEKIALILLSQNKILILPK